MRSSCRTIFPGWTGCCCSPRRRGRFACLIDSDLIATWRAQGFAKMMGAIPIKPSPKSTKRAIETAREALNAGELVCIFPEGGISRSGQLQRFKPGVIEIQRGTGAPIIPVYLDELWGSIFSFRGGKFFWKWPTTHPRRVSIWFGKPIYDPQDIHEVRQAVQDLGADAVAGRKQRTAALPRAMIRNCRKSHVPPQALGLDRHGADRRQAAGRDAGDAPAVDAACACAG